MSTTRIAVTRCGLVALPIAGTMFLVGCVGVQRPDGGTGLAVGLRSEVAAAAVSSFPGGDVAVQLLGLGGTGTAGAYAAFLAGKNRGWDEKAKDGRA